MKILFSVILIGLASLAFSQDTVKYINKEVLVDREPAYPAGEMALYSFIYQNLRFPDAAKKQTIDVEVSVSWEVLTDGSVGNVQFLRKAGYGIDEEIEKLIRSQKFLPCIQEGKIVKMTMMMNLPVQRRADTN
ncbi:MAG: hypothetical protein A2W91_00930 [Bacteroidetes bacterium GWF2_38_335]|nr:MAG: hypothetical protein A2W91_00930 [Bacteroidetes bacterium GWF2_38_335]OFY80318.1 MAG: hypothetical protein A2281_17440 [Bacteroidetes bacterium RIFOXYA12_FULL_38_20]HBS88882.1 hypothetical protein [Bacteroidales bacterium]